MPPCHGLSTPTLCLQLPHTLPSLRPKARLASLCVQRGHPLPVPFLAASPVPLGMALGTVCPHAESPGPCALLKGAPF